MKKWLLVAVLIVLPLQLFAAFLEVTWNANTETDLAGYKVYYKASTASNWTMVDVGNVLKLTVPDVLENVEYCAQVSAYDNVGNESPKTVAVCAILDTAPPATPTGIKAKLLKLLAWFSSLWA